MTLRSVSALLAIMLLGGQAQATTVYKSVDKHGNVVFSDTPAKGAERIKVAPVSTMKLNKPKLSARPTKKLKDKAQLYQSLSITEPDNDQHFINNQGAVSIRVSTEPPLNSQHQIRILLNGKKRGEPQSSADFSFANLDRGSYQAMAQIIDSNGNVLKSSQRVNFHIKRAFQKPNSKPKPKLRNL